MKYVLTEEQVGRIADVVNKSKIASPELKEELIDHLCCTVEDIKSRRDEDFEPALRIAVRQLSPNGLDEIQNEVVFLSTSASRKRLNAAVRISGMAALTGALATVLMKALHLPFAQLVLLATACVVVFAFLPSLFFCRLKRVPNKKFIPYTCGFVSALLLVVAVVFFVSHYPAAHFILLAAIVCLYLALLPKFFFKVFRKVK